jgi:chromosome segregation ATPase
MNKFMLKMNLPVFLALVFVITSCSHTMNVSKDNSTSTYPSAADDQHSQEIVELNQVVKQNSQSSKAKNAHHKLARLYTDHNNHRRNYYKAIKHLEAYIILDESPADDETLNWLAALKEINHLSKEIHRLSKEITRVQKQLKKSNKSITALTKTNRKLTREEIKLREKNRKLEESNQKLHKTIEMLKNLDQRLEEKRRNFNN